MDSFTINVQNIPATGIIAIQYQYADDDAFTVNVVDLASTEFPTPPEFEGATDPVIPDNKFVRARFLGDDIEWGVEGLWSNTVNWAG